MIGQAAPYMRLTDEQRKLVVDNLGLVGYVIAQHKWHHMACVDDLFQIGAIGLMKAVMGFDNRRAKFSTFAIRCIHNQLRQEWRRIHARTRNDGAPDLSLDAPLSMGSESGTIRADVIADAGPSVEDRVAEADSMNRIDTLLDALDDKAALVARMYLLDGVRQADIARRTGISQPYVSRLINRSLKWLRKKLEEENHDAGR